VIFLDFIIAEENGYFVRVGILHMEAQENSKRADVFEFGPGKNPCLEGDL
jgi:hypothetical protein